MDPSHQAGNGESTSEFCFIDVFFGARSKLRQSGDGVYNIPKSYPGPGPVDQALSASTCIVHTHDLSDTEAPSSVTCLLL